MSYGLLFQTAAEEQGVPFHVAYWYGWMGSRDDQALHAKGMLLCLGRASRERANRGEE